MIHFLFAFTGFLLLGYALLIFYYHRIWDRIPEPGPLQKDSDLPAPEIKISVIIPARNEGPRIVRCVESLLMQLYPPASTEIIIVNDFSTDDTLDRLSPYRDKCIVLNLSDFVKEDFNSFKKKALATGIAHSSGELILCTDADCTMGENWIRTMAGQYQKGNFVFLAAPVKIIPDGSWLSVFQALDFISLQGITGAAVYKNLYPMCNGANLAYSRKAYEAVGGFTDIDHIASGDDMLLMKKIQEKFPGRAGFIKDRAAIVNTIPAGNIRAFLNQRIRWASKISHYRHMATFTTLAAVYILNLSLLLLFISCFFYGYWRWLLFLLAFKTISEYFFVSKVAGFFHQESLMKYFPLCQPFHILYTVVAGSFGSFGKYEWKNRKVK